MNETKQAGKVNATEQQILFWFRNRRRENKIKRDPNYCDGDSSEISDGGGIWITDTPPTKPQTRNLFEEIDEHDNMNNVISHEDESLDNPSETEFGWRPRLKPSKEQLGWKVMKNLNDIKLIAPSDVGKFGVPPDGNRKYVLNPTVVIPEFSIRSV